MSASVRERTARRRGPAVAVVLAIVGAVAGLLAFGLTRDPGAGPSPLLGEPAPAFELQTLEGDRTVRLADLRGQVVVVNFFASWCAECRVEHPALLAAWQRYRDRGVVFLGVAFQDPLDRSIAFVKELGGDWPALRDPDAEVARSFGVFGVPETYFIGPDGRVAGRHVGPVEYGLLSRRISALLDTEEA